LEFVTTYGWVILMLAIALAVLIAIGVFNFGSSGGPSICSFSAKMGCVSAYLSSNGIIMLNLQQASPYAISVTAIGCNDQGLALDMVPVLPPITMSIGGNSTFALQCYRTVSGTLTPFSGLIGQSFKGYAVVNYTDLTTGFPHTAVGTLIESVSSG